MPSITTELAALLSTVDRPGGFFAVGTTDLLAPLVEVDGVDPVALPLLPMQAQQLVAVAAGSVRRKSPPVQTPSLALENH
jgi:hypothetical protein